MVSYVTITGYGNLYFEHGGTINLDGTEEFDTGELIIKHVVWSDPFPEGEDAIVTVGSSTFRYIIQADKVERITSSRYNHTLTLVEETAKLTKKYSTDRFFTLNTDGELFSHYEILSTVWDGLFFGKTNPYTISTATQTALSPESPSKKFVGMNSYEIAQDIMRGIKSVPRLVNDVLTHTPYNELGSQITFANIQGSEKTADFNNYATTILSKAKNIVYETDLQIGGTWFPSSTEGVQPRSSEGAYDDTKAEWQIDRAIHGVLVSKLLDVVITDGVDTYTIDMDISNYVVSKEKWDGLELGSNVLSTLYGEIAQRNTIYYSIGGTTITNLATTLRPNVTAYEVTTIGVLINSWCDNDATYTGFHWKGGAFGTSQDIIDLKLQVFYYPQYDADISAEKWATDVNKRSEILSNQSDSVVDLARYGNVINNIAQRMANGDWLLSVRHADDTELLELNDYTSDYYKIIKASHSIYSKHIDSVYQLSKKWITLDGYQTVYRSTDPYVIGSDNVKSNFRYEEYLELSTTQRTKTGHLTTQGMETLLNGFDYTSADDLPIYHAQFANDDASSNQGSQAITMSAVASGSNCIRLHCGFENPKLAGNQLKTESDWLSVARYGNDAVYYTDENGYLESASVYFVHDVTTFGHTHPLTAYQSVILFSFVSQDYLLNPNDIWGLTIELKPCTDEPDAIIVYEGFSIYNNLVRLFSTAPPIKVYVSESTTRYDEFDTMVKESTASTATFTVDFTNFYIDVSSVTGTDTKTWAVGYEVGTEAHLLFAVNYDGTTRQRIYINNLLERTTTEAL